MLGRVLWGIVVLSLIVSLSVAVERSHIEQENSTVQLVLDYPGLARLAADHGLSNEEVLSKLSEATPFSLAIGQRNLGEYALMNQELPSHVQEYLQQNPAMIGELVKEPVGFWESDLEIATRAGLTVVPRIAEGPWGFSFSEDLGGNLLIFTGTRVLGYPEDLSEVNQWIAEHRMTLGSVEFSSQAGFTKLAGGNQVVRVHSITQGEMDKLPSERIISRYLRAVRERNIRVLYLRPILSGSAPIELTTNLLADLSTELEGAGYQLGTARPYQDWTVGKEILLLTWSGVVAGALLLTGFFVNLNLIIGLILFFSMLLMVFALSLFSLTVAQQVMALGAAVVFPILAILQISRKEGNPWVRYLSCSGISLAGALLVGASLSGSDYLVKLAEFRGVKLMHVLPVIGVLVYGLGRDLWPLTDWQRLRVRLLKVWELSIPLKILALSGLALLVSSVYLLRTGNFGLPVLEAEIYLRETLERLLVVRPRTKEVFLGHPLLFLSVALFPKFSFLLVIAVIGQLSLVNTFTHIHTPILVSLLRTFYGLVFGGMIGWILWRAYLILRELGVNDRAFRVLRIRQPR